MKTLFVFLPYITIWIVFRLWWMLAGKKKQQKPVVTAPVKGDKWLQALTFILLILFIVGFYATESSMIRDPLVRTVGNIVMLFGLGFAAWAKQHMGANWSMPNAKVKGGKLVTTGPFRYIRHPIYSGIWLAMVGTALATNWHVLAIALVCGINFVVFALAEEKTLAREFPKDYRAYKAKSKLFIPFVW